MNPSLWMLTGAGALMVIGVVVAAVVDSEFGAALCQVLATLIIGPALAIVYLVRSHGARTIRLSPETLQRFAKQQGSTVGQSAWAFAYRGRGVILVRRREGTDWLNDVPNRTARVEREARRRG